MDETGIELGTYCLLTLYLSPLHHTGVSWAEGEAELAMVGSQREKLVGRVGGFGGQNVSSFYRLVSYQSIVGQ